VVLITGNKSEWTAELTTSQYLMFDVRTLLLPKLLIFSVRGTACNRSLYNPLCRLISRPLQHSPRLSQPCCVLHTALPCPGSELFKKYLQCVLAARILTVDFVVCTLAMKKKNILGQVSTCRIGPFPCQFSANYVLWHFHLPSKLKIRNM
jgi:hypothetical protein